MCIADGIWQCPLAMCPAVATQDTVDTKRQRH